MALARIYGPIWLSYGWTWMGHSTTTFSSFGTFDSLYKASRIRLMSPLLDSTKKSRKRKPKSCSNTPTRKSETWPKTSVHVSTINFVCDHDVELSYVLRAWRLLFLFLLGGGRLYERSCALSLRMAYRPSVAWNRRSGRSKVVREFFFSFTDSCFSSCFETQDGLDAICRF